MSGILESNQKPQSYQLYALTDCANARKLPLCQLIYVTGHRETDYTHMYKTHVISHSALYRFHPKGVYRFNLLGLEIAAILPCLVVTAISDGLVIIK